MPSLAGLTLSVTQSWLLPVSGILTGYWQLVLWNGKC